METYKSAEPPFPELRGALTSNVFPAFIEPKYDGEFTYVHIEEGCCFTVNKYGTLRMEFPALNSIEKMCQGHSATFLAELFFNGGLAGKLYDLNSNKQSDNVQIVCFDILQLDKKDLRNEPLLDRKELLSDLLGKAAIYCRYIETEDELKSYYEQFLKQGYEGAVVKAVGSRLMLGPCNWVKIKNKDRNDYVVHYVDPTAERIEVMVPAGIGSVTLVGVKAINKYKIFIGPGDVVTIEHQGILASGSLRHPVLIPKPEWK